MRPYYEADGITIYHGDARTLTVAADALITDPPYGVRYVLPAGVVGTGNRRRERGGKPLHPTQKPVALMRWVLDKTTKPGDLVFDPFMGSGPIARACADMGRRYVGCELVEEYCEAAANRLAQGVLELTA